MNLDGSGNSPGSHLSVGQRIRKFRADRGMSLNMLSDQSGVSKGYLSNLENSPDGGRPSAESLYVIAKALGVTMSDLLGRKLLVEQGTLSDVPDELRQFGRDAALPETDIQMLANIRFRGEQPRAKERWEYIYNAIKLSAGMDRGAPDHSG